MIRILALDQSLSATGAAWWTVGTALPPGDGKPLPVWRSSETWATPKKLKGAERLKWIKTRLVDEIAKRVDLLVIEGYAPRGINDALALGELGGMIRLTAHERDVPILVVTPSERIAYMSDGTMSTRAGTDALKSAAKKTAIAELGADDDIDDNQADALWLAEIGAHYLGYVPHMKAGCTVSRSQVILQLLLTPEQIKALKQEQKEAAAARTLAAKLKREAKDLKKAA